VDECVDSSVLFIIKHGKKESNLLQLENIFYLNKGIEVEQKKWQKLWKINISTNSFQRNSH
jgi:hypothetical protein